jgi:hypothetical protein
MGLPQRNRPQSSGEDEAYEIVRVGRAVEARVDQAGQLVRTVQNTNTSITYQALYDTAWLCMHAERLAGANPVLQAALAAVLDQGLLEVQITQHRGSEQVRRAGGM